MKKLTLKLKLRNLFTLKKSKEKTDATESTKKCWEESWVAYTKGGIKWQHKIVTFVISNPEYILRDDKLWNEFTEYIHNLELYDWYIDEDDDRLEIVKDVAFTYEKVISDTYNYNEIED